MDSCQCIIGKSKKYERFYYLFSIFLLMRTHFLITQILSPSTADNIESSGASCALTSTCGNQVTTSCPEVICSDFPIDNIDSERNEPIPSIARLSHSRKITCHEAKCISVLKLDKDKLGNSSFDLQPITPSPMTLSPTLLSRIDVSDDGLIARTRNDFLRGDFRWWNLLAHF